MELYPTTQAGSATAAVASFSEDHASRVRHRVRSLFPLDFDWCGGCAGKTRDLTEGERAAILRALPVLLDEFSASDVFEYLIWPMEIDGRHVCTCAHPRRHPRLPTDGFFVYRLWTKDQRLLYVGSTVRLRERLATHRRRWADLIDSVTWEQFETPGSMLEAESAAIRDEVPAMNKKGV